MECILQVGASNELPESEELDALYDRFLIRRQVSQVSDAGLPAMLAAAADNNLAVRTLAFLRQQLQVMPLALSAPVNYAQSMLRVTHSSWDDASCLVVFKVSYEPATTVFQWSDLFNCHWRLHNANQW